MKAVKRATCPICKYDTTTSEHKVDKQGNSTSLKCPNEGTPLRISAQWYVTGQHNGKKLRQPCGLKKADAEDFIAACRIAKRSGTVLPGQESDITWSEAVENCNGWGDAEVERKKMRPGSRDHYKYQVLILDKYFAGLTLLTITKTSVKGMMDDLSKTHAPATVAHAVKALKRIYTMHTENLDLEEEPRPKLVEKAFIISKVELPKVDNEKTKCCTATDLQSVLAVIAKCKGRKRDKARLRLAIMLGVGMLMRPANINALEWAEIDFTNGIIRISGDKMKGKRDFEKGVPEMILAELKSWRVQCGVISKFVFPLTRKKNPNDPDQPIKSMYKAVTHWIKEAGLNPDKVDRKAKITPYILTRHTGATELYEESGENLEMVSKTADHADSRITRKRYVKNRVEYSKQTVVPIQNAMLKRMVGG